MACEVYSAHFECHKTHCWLDWFQWGATDKKNDLHLFLIFFSPIVFSEALNSLSLSLLSPCLSSSSSPHLPNWFSCILSSAPKWANRRTAHRHFKALLLIYTSLFLFCVSPESSLSLALFLISKLVSMLYVLSSTSKTEGKQTQIHTTDQNTDTVSSN